MVLVVIIRDKVADQGSIVDTGNCDDVGAQDWGAGQIEGKWHHAGYWSESVSWTGFGGGSLQYWTRHVRRRWSVGMMRREVQLQIVVVADGHDGGAHDDNCCVLGVECDWSQPRRLGRVPLKNPNCPPHHHHCLSGMFARDHRVTPSIATTAVVICDEERPG